MRQLFVTMAAMAALVAPLAVTPAFAQYHGRADRPQQSQRNDDRRDGQSSQRDDRSNPGWGQGGPQRGDRQEELRRSDRRDRYERGRSWRDDRAEAPYDASLHNGYYVGKRWIPGPPPQSRRGDRNVQLGYRPWARGQHLGYYSGRYAEVDYRENRLRKPPRGYHWVRDNDGDYLLAAVVGGLIAQVILHERY